MALRSAMSIKSIFVIAAVFFLIPLISSSTALPEYDETIAKKFSYFSGATYCYESKIHNVTRWALTQQCLDMSNGFTITGTFFDPKLDAFAFVGFSHEEQLIVASVKGTTPNHMRDWFVDFKSLISYKSECVFQTTTAIVHKGFCEEYVSLKSLGLFTAVVALHEQYPTYKIVSTGHSLGGAVATLLAFDLLSSNSATVSLYTYGQPRTGTSDFAQRFSDLIESVPGSEYHRITHFKDLVAHLPLCKAGKDGLCVKDNLHPYHAGYQVHYEEDMTTPFTLCGWEDGLLCSPPYSISVDDHRMYFGNWLSVMCCPDTALLSSQPGRPDDIEAWMVLQEEAQVQITREQGPVEYRSQ